MNKAMWMAGLMLMLMCGMALAEPDAHQHADTFAENFKRVDTDHDGRLSMAEAEKNAPGLALRFALIDANHDGFLSEQEIRDFVQAFVQQQRRKSAQRFKDADKDHNGALSREEARALPGLSAHFDEMDANRDGQLTLQEIGDYVRAQARQRRQGPQRDKINY